MTWSSAVQLLLVVAAAAVGQTLRASAFVVTTTTPTTPLRTATTTSTTATQLCMTTSLLQRQTGQSQLDPTVMDRYNALPFPPHKVLAEYVWVDADGNLRSKTRTLSPDKIQSVETLPEWNFDGSSTGQAPGDDSEVILKPRRIFRDPFRVRPQDNSSNNNNNKINNNKINNNKINNNNVYNVLVLCDTWTPDGQPLPSNTRHQAEQSFLGHDDEHVWFGMEQEFTLFNLDERTPLGWPDQGCPNRPQGPYYCSVGPENHFGRHVVDAHYRACLFAGIDISGTNGEVMPGQQEYQVGPCVGIDAGDQLMMSRYLLLRVCEDFQVFCTLHPKPIVLGDWNGAGMHTNVSTKKMREQGGLEIIKKAIYKLGAKHAEHIAVYGEGNELRLTGKFETASIDQFSYGVANRGASIRIGRQTEADGRGYFEDRRPSSNADPYLVTGKIMSTIMEEVEVPVLAAKNKD